MFVNMFRNILLPQQMFPRLRGEETFREKLFLQQCFLVCGYLERWLMFGNTCKPCNTWTHFAKSMLLIVIWYLFTS